MDGCLRRRHNPQQRRAVPRQPARHTVGVRATAALNCLPAPMNAPEHLKTSAKTAFNWPDPLLLDAQLSEEERMVRDAAHAYAQDKLMPRVTEAFRHEKS